MISEFITGLLLGISIGLYISWIVFVVLFYGIGKRKQKKEETKK